MLDFPKLGSEIAIRRRALELRQDELAALAGISRPTLSRLEAGAMHDLGFKKLMRILGALRLDLRLTEANVGRPTLEDLQREGANSEGKSQSAEPLRRRVRRKRAP